MLTDGPLDECALGICQWVLVPRCDHVFLFLIFWWFVFVSLNVWCAFLFESDPQNDSRRVRRGCLCCVVVILPILLL